VQMKDAGTGLGVGVLWLEPDNYKLYALEVGVTLWFVP